MQKNTHKMKTKMTKYVYTFIFSNWTKNQLSHAKECCEALSLTFTYSFVHSLAHSCVCVFFEPILSLFLFCHIIHIYTHFLLFSLPLLLSCAHSIHLGVAIPCSCSCSNSHTNAFFYYYLYLYSYFVRLLSFPIQLHWPQPLLPFL